MKGKIEKWLSEKNFGFINIGEARGLFFHKNDLAEGYEPKEGDTVEFEKTQGEKGPMAVKVRKVEESAEEIKPDEAEKKPAEETKEETEEKSGIEEIAEEVKPDEAEKKAAEEVKEEIQKETEEAEKPAEETKEETEEKTE